VTDPARTSSTGGLSGARATVADVKIGDAGLGEPDGGDGSAEEQLRRSLDATSRLEALRRLQELAEASGPDETAA
jgi:hypothetical protein